MNKCIFLQLLLHEILCALKCLLFVSLCQENWCSLCGMLLSNNSQHKMHPYEWWGEADLGHFVTLRSATRSLILSHKTMELASFMGHLQLLGYEPALF